MLPFHEDKDSTVYLGVLMCLRHMIPNLDCSFSFDHQMKGLRGSFGSHCSYSADGTLGAEQIQNNQLLQVHICLMLLYSQKFCVIYSTDEGMAFLDRRDLKWLSVFQLSFCIILSTLYSRIGNWKQRKIRFKPSHCTWL